MNHIRLAGQLLGD